MAEAATPPFERTSDFRSGYANNIQFELSPFDLKLTFGITENGKPTRQHTSINMTWVQAKLMHYYLTANLTVFEKMEGKIPIHSTLLPSLPIEPTPQQEAESPSLRIAYNAVVELRAKLLESL